ncbi:uncharacterized protein PSFLO_06353 [Pseudozyma flocculosa]|uniref:Uncharacterized protein n=1 Tax=Pseudozyma flocculosa TaxID=84751 RepID=A0A5C3FBK2_9BASI|nr:uncharacterized protein PSFLO_06353 [Pseudozyma flocculosa]
MTVVCLDPASHQLGTARRDHHHRRHARSRRSLRFALVSRSKRRPGDGIPAAIPVYRPPSTAVARHIPDLVAAGLVGSGDGCRRHAPPHPTASS